jgi:hypothetical protein
LCARRGEYFARQSAGSRHVRQVEIGAAVAAVDADATIFAVVVVLVRTRIRAEVLVLEADRRGIPLPPAAAAIRSKRPASIAVSLRSTTAAAIRPDVFMLSAQRRPEGQREYCALVNAGTSPAPGYHFRHRAAGHAGDPRVWRRPDDGQRTSRRAQRPQSRAGRFFPSAQRRFERAARKAVKERFGRYPVLDEEEAINFQDWFALQARLPDGRTVVEHVVDARPDLPEEERALLLGWRDVVEGVKRRGGEALLRKHKLSIRRPDGQTAKRPEGKDGHRPITTSR